MAVERREIAAERPDDRVVQIRCLDEERAGPRSCPHDHVAQRLEESFVSPEIIPASETLSVEYYEEPGRPPERGCDGCNEPLRADDDLRIKGWGSGSISVHSCNPDIRELPP
jgi:hypothetical protein